MSDPLIEIGLQDDLRRDLIAHRVVQHPRSIAAAINRIPEAPDREVDIDAMKNAVQRAQIVPKRRVVFAGRDAIVLLDEVLHLCVMRGDRRCGAEAIRGLAAAHASLGNRELAVRLDAISQGLSEAMGIVDPPGLLELLGSPIRRARKRPRPGQCP